MKRPGRNFARTRRLVRVGLAGCSLILASFALHAEPATSVAETALPLVGEIGGALKLDRTPDLGLVWRVSFESGDVVLATHRPGIDISARIERTADSSWRWAIVRGDVDLAELWPLLREQLGEPARGWSASGHIRLSGEGTLSGDGIPVGVVTLSLRGGWARSDELEVELGGVEFDIETDDLTRPALRPGQTLRVGKVSLADTALGAIEVVFGADAESIEIVSGQALLLGGTVDLRPFRLLFSKPEVDTAADVTAIDLAEAARLLPWLIESAQGRLRGAVQIAWNESKGVRLRDGGLTIEKSDDAVIRLAPSPGLFTAKIPERFNFLPWKWARALGAKNPAYEPLREIELGREGLRIETFRVELHPDGVGQGRTAVIHIVGRPTSGKLVEAVRIDVNFHGPWSEFLAFGLNNGLSAFSFRFE